MHCWSLTRKCERYLHLCIGMDWHGSQHGMHMIAAAAADAARRQRYLIDGTRVPGRALLGHK